MAVHEELIAALSQQQALYRSIENVYAAIQGY